MHWTKKSGFCFFTDGKQHKALDLDMITQEIMHRGQTWTVTDRFANLSVRQRMKSIRQRLMSVRHRPKCSLKLIWNVFTNYAEEDNVTLDVR